MGKAVDALRARRRGQNEKRSAALGLALALQGYFASWVGHTDQAETLLRESMSILGGLGARREVALAYTLVTFLLPQNHSESRQLLEQSLAIARELGYYPAMTRALMVLSGLALVQGMHREAEQYARELLDVCKRLDARADAAFAHTWLGHSAFLRGEFVQARRHYEDGLALFEAVGQTWAVGRLHSHLGDTALAAGDYDEAREQHRQALARCRDVGVYWKEETAAVGGCWGIPISLQRLGDVALKVGDTADARGHYRQSLETAIHDPHRELHLQVLLGPVRLSAQEGDVERAVELAALARHHPASVEETRDRAEELLDELRSELRPDASAAAEARGRARELEATVRELLADLEMG